MFKFDVNMYLLDKNIWIFYLLNFNSLWNFIFFKLKRFLSVLYDILDLSLLLFCYYFLLWDVELLERYNWRL